MCLCENKLSKDRFVWKQKVLLLKRQDCVETNCLAIKKKAVLLDGLQSSFQFIQETNVSVVCLTSELSFLYFQLCFLW